MQGSALVTGNVISYGATPPAPRAAEAPRTTRSALRKSTHRRERDRDQREHRSAEWRIAGNAYATGTISITMAGPWGNQEPNDSALSSQTMPAVIAFLRSPCRARAGTSCRSRTPATRAPRTSPTSTTRTAEQVVFPDRSSPRSRIRTRDCLRGADVRDAGKSVTYQNSQVFALNPLLRATPSSRSGGVVPELQHLLPGVECQLLRVLVCGTPPQSHDPCGPASTCSTSSLDASFSAMSTSSRTSPPWCTRREK